MEIDDETETQSQTNTTQTPRELIEFFNSSQ